MKPIEKILKRLLDILLSSCMILISTPFALAIALAIKLEDGGPVFYRQKRWGKNGSHFNAYKFRTMVIYSDKMFGVQQAKENDPRITNVGRVLRAMGMDELPQLLNILQGEMSFVGPRSLAVGEIVKDKNGQVIKYEDIPNFNKRLKVKPGLTGLATIYIPKDALPTLKLRYDLLYIKKQSFWLDLRLIALSFWISFRGKWEERQKKW